MERWPKCLTPLAVSFTMAGTARAGTRTVGGAQQYVASDAGYWKASYSNIVLRGDKVLAFRAVMAQMQGPLVPWLIGPYDRARTPATRAKIRAEVDTGTPFSDKQPFSDDTLFGQPYPLAMLRSNRAVRSTSLVVRCRTGVEIVSGQYLGINDRLYLVARTEPYGTNVRDKTVTIWPPLRQAADAGTLIEVENPVCPMRLVGPDSPTLELQYLRFGSISLNFEEVV